MPIISVSLLAGRPADTKRRFIKALTDAAAASLAVDPGTVRVIVTEIAPEHWAVGGISKADAARPDRIQGDKRS